MQTKKNIIDLTKTTTTTTTITTTEYDSLLHFVRIFFFVNYDIESWNNKFH